MDIYSGELDKGDNITMDTFLSQISFTSGKPRYIQLADFLEQVIKQNLFESKFLPPERELAKLLNLSRVTISNALKLLEDKNLIIRQQGLGTQINTQLDYSLNKLSGFTERMENAGFSVSDRWLNKKRVIATNDIMQQFGFPINSEVAYLHRVRSIDNCPISIESTYLPLDVLPEPETFTGSLYAYLANRKIYIATQTIYFDAINCDETSANLLHQTSTTPLLKIHEINKNNKGKVIEISEIQCLSRYYALKIEL